MIQLGGTHWSRTRFDTKHICLLKQVQSIFGLMKKKTGRGSVNLNAKEIMNISQILDRKQGLQLRNDGLANSRRTPSDDNIIHINQYKSNSRVFLDKRTSIRGGRNKSQ
ncbi:hypothetical protein C1H46_031711 [Malus baccata]|uniref:Uncharacterized protein n=1 Tax=Malus baccata TaxID=106549 RepID=A0A540L914_MALBA|nr:hypothetical protein C1H46_031711 [Malus baccata]